MLRVHQRQQVVDGPRYPPAYVSACVYLGKATAGQRVARTSKKRTRVCSRSCVACSHNTPYRVFPTPVLTQSPPNPRVQSLNKCVLPHREPAALPLLGRRELDARVMPTGPGLAAPFSGDHNWSNQSSMTESTGRPFARDPRRPASCEPRRDPGGIESRYQFYCVDYYRMAFSFLRTART